MGCCDDIRDTPPRKWHGLGRDKQRAEKDPTLGDWEFI